MPDTIKLRRGTAALWTSRNPVLRAGEPGLETDTGKVKYGDGVTAWVSLAYAPSGSIPDGSITSADLADGAVTLAKTSAGVQATLNSLTLAGAGLMGNSTAGAATRITVGSEFSLAGNTLSLTYPAESVPRSALDSSTAASLALADTSLQDLDGLEILDELIASGWATQASGSETLVQRDANGWIAAGRITIAGNSYLSDTGELVLHNGAAGVTFDPSQLTLDRTCGLPDSSGTLALQEWVDTQISSLTLGSAGLLGNSTAGAATLITVGSEFSLAGDVLSLTYPAESVPRSALDSSTAASLALADSATQPADLAGAVDGLASEVYVRTESFPLWPSTLEGTYDDDFTAASLAGKWTQQGGSGADLTFQTGGGSWLQLNCGTAVDTVRAIYQAWTSTTNAEIVVRCRYNQLGGGHPVWGPFFVDSAGNGIAASWYSNSAVWTLATVTTWTVPAFAATSTLTGMGNYNQLTPASGLWMKLRKAGTTYYASYSVDGYMWSGEISVVNATAMTRCGVGQLDRFAGGAATTDSRLAIDFFALT